MADDCTESPLTEYFYEPFWNMMQLVAWVYTRDPGLVHRASGRNADYGTYFAELTVPSGERRLAELSGAPVSVTYLLLSRLLREGKNAPNLDVHIAMHAVMHALCEGRLSVTGIPAGGANPDKIEADAWAYLELFETDRHEVCARLSDGPHKYDLRYSSLKVKRDEVLAIWPSGTEVETQQRASRRAAGRYQLREAAEEIAEHTGERADDLVKKLMQAVSSAALPVYRPGENQRYTPETVRDFYDEVHAEDLNEWLQQNEPRITWHFPSLESSACGADDVSAIASTPDTRRPPQTLPWQEDEILRVLVELGYTPLALPKRKGGGSDAKGSVKAKLVPKSMSDAAFNKAWTRLRAEGNRRVWEAD